MSEQYPEHAKMRAVKDRSQAIGEFVSWLYENGMEIANADDSWMNPAIEPLLARFFGIDLAKISDEKQAMYESLTEPRS